VAMPGYDRSLQGKVLFPFAAVKATKPDTRDPLWDMRTPTVARLILLCAYEVAISDEVEGATHSLRLLS